MTYQLAQLNLVRFKLPQDHPTNADCVNSLDRVNAIAEQQPGFVWRFTGAGNNAMDVQAFDDPHIAANMSVWANLNALKDLCITTTPTKASCAGAKSGLIKWNSTWCSGGLSKATYPVWKKPNRN